MSTNEAMKQGTVVVSRRFDAPRPVVFAAWTGLEHRRQWFAGPGWKEIERSVDFRVGGIEIARGRFENGIETIYTARFHVIEPNERLIYDFDMHVAGAHFSVSLAGVEFNDVAGGTELTYTEAGCFLVGEYDAEGRAQGTNGLLDQFAAHVATLTG